jgi:hypothetical protein
VGSAHDVADPEYIIFDVVWLHTGSSYPISDQASVSCCLRSNGMQRFDVGQGAMAEMFGGVGNEKVLRAFSVMMLVLWVILPV